MARSPGPGCGASATPCPLLCGSFVTAVLAGMAGVTWKWREAAAANDETQAINDFLIHKLLDQASTRFNPRGARLTVGELLDNASARLKLEFENRPAVEASIRRTIGSAYQSLGLYESAEPQVRETVALDSRLRGPKDRQTLSDTNLLTSVLDAAARYSEAEPLGATESGKLHRCAGPG